MNLSRMPARRIVTRSQNGSDAFSQQPRRGMAFARRVNPLAFSWRPSGKTDGAGYCSITSFSLVSAKVLTRPSYFLVSS